MKTQIVLFAVALFCAKVRTQQCYQCLTLSAYTMRRPLGWPGTLPGFVPCDGQQEIVDCGPSGGCLNAKYNFVYFNDDSAEAGRIVIEARGCGEDRDECLTGGDLPQIIDEQRATINALPPAGNTFAYSTGTECNCNLSRNLCNDGELRYGMNGAAVGKISFGGSLMALLVSFVATKRY